MRMLGLGTRQQDLVRTVEGIKYTQLEGMDQCCGFGGTFSFKNADVSGARSTTRQTTLKQPVLPSCTGGDCSCLMNIGGALMRRARTSDHPLR